MTGRAKWDAWKSAGATYHDGAEVEKRYLQIARDLGWTEGTASTAQSKPETVEDEEINWDEDDDVPSQGSSKPSGLGPSVSVMLNEDEAPEDATTIHDFAVSGDTERIEGLLKGKPDLNVNELDENGYTPLHLASDRGNVSVVKLLLEKGADPTIKDADDMTAGAIAEVAGHHEIVRLLSKP
ncbi:hypothetical protein V5O48_006148 [Marasmius crinis-equi]|uniref:Ankyrin n=1 Tax=Marasmius crinis-equi TaxID=585013 RepID=A0ABR3FKN8_9AGAR